MEIRRISSRKPSQSTLGHKNGSIGEITNGAGERMNKYILHRRIVGVNQLRSG